MVRTVIAAALAFVAVAASAQGWDVTNTGEPAEDVEFKVSEGTWMSLDVSPDGRTLVFDLLGDIYSMSASGGAAHALLDGPAMQRSPLFSADGSKLLYLSDASGDDNVWIANADGSSPRQLTHETVDVLTGPAWGPDDQSVIAAKMESVVSKLHSSEIRLFDVRGGSAGRESVMGGGE